MELLRPLTPTEEKVAELVARGLTYARIGSALGMDERTASVHVVHIAQKIVNPEQLKPYTLVLLWAAQRQWTRDRELAVAI